MAYDIESVIQSYADYLRTLKRKGLWEQFQKRRRDAPESAKAEAVVFRILQYCGADPEVADMPKSGGLDFLCFKDKPGRFLVEATSFRPEKVTKDTGIPNEVPEGITGGPIGLLTIPILRKGDEKSPQFEKLAIPGVLAVVSSHFGAAVVLDKLAAQYALTSSPSWTISDDRLTTNFAQSLFLKMEEDGIIACRNPKISALLLVSVTGDRSYVCGALNPSAEYRLDSSLVWMINFVYLKDWPLENKRVRWAWTMGDGYSSYEVPHAPIMYFKKVD